MKKIIVGGVLVLAIATVAVPYGVGLVMEKEYTKGIEKLNTMYGDLGTNTSFEIVRYDRSIFSSEIEVQLNLGTMKNIYGVESVIFIDRAKHGYTGVISTTSLEKSSWYNDAVEKELGGVDPLEIVTTYHYSGEFQTKFTLKPFSLTVEEEVLKIEGGQFTVNGDSSLKNFTMEGNWGGLKVTDKFSIGASSFTCDMDMISTYLGDYNVQFSLENMRVDDTGMILALEGLKGTYRMDVDQEGGKIAVEATYGVDSIGDDLEQVKDASLTIGSKGIDRDAYEEAMAVYVKMMGSLMESLDAETKKDPDQFAIALQEQMMQAGVQLLAVYEKFLKIGLEIYVKDLHATLPEGKVEGDFSLMLTDDLSMAEMMPMMNEPQMILDYLSINSNAVLPKEVVGDPGMLLSPLVPQMKTGFFVESGQNLVHKLETRDKKVFLNDIEMPLAW